MNFLILVPVVDYDDAEISDNEESQECETDQSDDENLIESDAQPTRGKIHSITPRLVSALDNCKVSDRYATHILAAVADALGHPLQDLVINRESIRRSRDKYREELTKQIKEDFQANVK